MNQEEVLQAGVRILEPTLHRSGFRFAQGPAGPSSGGPFASGVFIKGDRKLEIHFRHSLGMVAYHLGAAMLPHEEFVRAARRGTGQGRYPGVSDDPLQAFRDLKADLDEYGTAFLHGPDEEFHSLVAWLGANPLPRGFHRLSRGGAA